MSFSNMLSELAMLARLTRDLPGFLRAPIAVEQAAAIVRHRLNTRSERFLQLAECMVYRRPSSPYLRLLRGVGCESGDLRALVLREGVEAALGRLADQGVYVSFDEFKGRREIVRGSGRFETAEEDFDNPRIKPHFEVRTGGTRNPSTSVKTSLQFIAEQAADHTLMLHSHGLLNAHHVVWLTAPIRDLLRYARLSGPPVVWFYPLRPLPWKIRAVGRYLHTIGSLVGRPLPPPTWIDLQQPVVLARWLSNLLGGSRPVCITTYTSSAVRVAVAAAEANLSLEGACFVTLGEAFTPPKQRALQAVGARALPRYGFAEAGGVAYRCAEARVSDDLHLFSDSYALIQRSRSVADFGFSVDALLFTTLLPSAPKILLNVESGDHGTLVRRECGCTMGAIGLLEHLSDVRSHEKLTGEGMTFAKTRLLRILEEVLPAHFGGSSADYQVLEEEDRTGILRLVLLVSPAVGPTDEAHLKRTFLRELGQADELEGYMARIWERAGTVEVRRQTPVATRAGKVLPFHLIKHQR